MLPEQWKRPKYKLQKQAKLSSGVANALAGRLDRLCGILSDGGLVSEFRHIQEVTGEVRAHHSH